MPLVYDDSIDNVQNQPGTALAVTASNTSSVYVTGSVTTSQSNWPAGSVTVTSSQALPVWVTGNIQVDIVAADEVFAKQSGAWSVQVSGVSSAPVYVGQTASFVVNTGTFPTATVTASITNPASVVVTGAFSVIDPGNSSTTPLAGNATFLGTAVDTLGFASVAWSIQSDVISAVGGIVPQWSQDNTNWFYWGGDSLASDRVGVNSGTDMVVRCHGRYFRLSYTNGASAQSYFRLQTTLNKYLPSGDTMGIAHTPNSGDDALLVKAGIFGLSTAGGGTFVDVKVSPAGAIQVAGTIDNIAANVGIVQSGALTVQVTGTPTPSNPVWVTFTGALPGTTTVSQSNDQRSVQASAWSALVSGTVGVTGSWANGAVLVTASSNSPVFVNTGTFPTVTVSMSNNPVITATFTGNLPIGTLTVNSHAVTQGGAWASLVSGTVGVTGTWANSAVLVTASSGAPVYVAFTGNLPLGSVAVTQGGAWASLVSGTVGVSGVHASGVQTALSAPVLVAGVDSTNTVRTLQTTAAGNLTIGQTGSINISMSNNPIVTATFTGNLPIGTLTVNSHAVTQGGAWTTLVSGTVGVTGTWANNAVLVTASSGNPVYVTFTGNLPIDLISTAATGGQAPPQTMYIGGNNAGTFRGMSVDANGYLIVTQSNDQRMIQAGALTALVSGTVGVTGTWANNAVLITASSVNPVYVGQTGNLWITASSTTPVYIGQTGSLTVSQSNLPAGTMLIDQSGSYTGSVTSFVASLTGVQLIAANVNRAGVTIYNQSSTPWYVRLGSTASLTNFTLIVDVSGYFETPWMYNGAVWGLQASAGTGLIYVTEVV